PRVGVLWSRLRLVVLTSAIAFAVHYPSPMANRWVSMEQKLVSTLRLTVRLDTTGDHGASDRLSLWRYAISKIEQHPFAGVGLGNFGVNDGDRLAEYWREAHNTWLHLGSELGLPGILLCLAVVLVLALAARRLLRRGRLTALQLGAIGAVVAYLACSFLETTIRSAQGANLIAAAMAGCLLGWAERPEPRPDDEAARGGT
ncbi:MAG TPA: O-antigen ligase family protein, partial [Polyangia bacterium]